jgi:hypothetical protein
MRRTNILYQPGQTVREDLSEKHSTQKRACRVAKVVERQPRKYEHLSSNPSTTTTPAPEKRMKKETIPFELKW